MSDRIHARWTELARARSKALVPYVTPEYPVKGSTVALVRGLEAAGASFIEIGIPFSDPLADGPVIQHASQVALRNGATPSRVLEIVHEIRQLSTIPILLMGYVNPLYRIGVEVFMDKAAAAGVDGLIIPDLPPGESSEIHAAARSRDLSMVYLVAPTSTDERLRQVDGLSTHFTYCVSMTGVTGASSRFAGTDALDAFLGRVRKNTTKPFVVGFGISNAADVRRVWKHADGAVVGSQLLRELEGCGSVDEVVEKGTSFFSALVSPISDGAVQV